MNPIQLPMDVLSHVCVPFLDVQDLFALIRTEKKWLSQLQRNPKALSEWSRLLRRLLPSPMFMRHATSFVTLFHWTKLFVLRGCTNCGAKGIRKINYEYGIRWCAPCIALSGVPERHLDKSISSKHLQKVKSSVPSNQVTLWNRFKGTYTIRCFSTHHLAMVDEHVLGSSLHQIVGDLQKQQTESREHQTNLQKRKRWASMITKELDVAIDPYVLSVILDPQLTEVPTPPKNLPKRCKLYEPWDSSSSEWLDQLVDDYTFIPPLLKETTDVLMALASHRREEKEARDMSEEKLNPYMCSIHTTYPQKCCEEGCVRKSKIFKTKGALVSHSQAKHKDAFTCGV